MEGKLQGRENPATNNGSFATPATDQVGFEQAIALVKQHQGAILIRTKSGHCMVRLANGNVLAVTPPAEAAKSSEEVRRTSEAKLQQEVDRLSKAILMNKNVLDKARHHLIEKDLEIRQLKVKLEEKEKEILIKNKIISTRGKLIEKLKEDIEILNKTPGQVPDFRVNSEQLRCDDVPISV